MTSAITVLYYITAAWIAASGAGAVYYAVMRKFDRAAPWIASASFGALWLYAITTRMLVNGIDPPI